MTAIEEGYITTAEAARLLGQHQDTIGRQIREGRLPATKLPGGNWRIRRSEIQALLEGNDR
jgi:excisionase family DNA binding protein